MLRRFRYKEIVWVDLESPSAEEVASLGQEFNIHPLVQNELLQPSHRAKVDLYNNYVYLILHFPISKGQQEVDFVLGKDFIITTHYEMINSLHDFGRIFETDFTLKKNTDKLHAGFVFFYIMREIYAALEFNLDSINDRLAAIEEKVFSGREREAVEALAAVNRELLDCRWSLKSHGEILTSLEIAGVEIFGDKFQYHLKTISGDHQKLWHTIENIRENFLDLRDTNDSLLAIKANHIMKSLAVAAFIFLPLSIVPQIFGISSANLPLMDQPYSLLIVLSGMAVTSGLLYWLARLKRWF